MLTAALAVLCALLVLVLLVQRPAIWPVLVILAVLWFALFGVFRYRVRSWVARWVCGGSFEKSKTQFSLEPLSQPAALLSGETVLWYNTEFRTRLMKRRSPSGPPGAESAARPRPAGGTQGQRPAAQSGRRRVERSQLHRPRRGREHDPSCPE